MDAVFLNEQNVTGIDSNVSQAKQYPQRLEAFEAPARTFLYIIFTTTALLAFTGNVVVIIVERFGTRSAKNLRKFLANLAVSDVLFGVICVPVSYTDFMLHQWIFPLWLCPLTQFVQVVSVFVTTFTLTVISIERYLAILFPLSDKIHWLTDKCNLILASGWIVGALIGLYPTLNTGTKEFTWNNETYVDCRPHFSETAIKYYSLTSFAVTFVIPLLIQSYSYASIARRLLGKTDDSNINLRRSSSVDEERAKVIQMLIAVVIAFAVCWLPVKTFMLLRYIWPNLMDISDNFSYYTYIISYFFCHWLAMANSFVNPIIYSFMSKSFRADLKDIYNQWRAQVNAGRVHFSKEPSPSLNSTKLTNVNVKSGQVSHTSHDNM